MVGDEIVEAPDSDTEEGSDILWGFEESSADCAMRCNRYGSPKGAHCHWVR